MSCIKFPEIICFEAKGGSRGNDSLYLNRMIQNYLLVVKTQMADAFIIFKWGNKINDACMLAKNGLPLPFVGDIKKDM